MPTDPKTDPPAATPPADPPEDERETAYWKKFDERVSSAVDKKLGELRDSARQSQQRTGRKTIPGMLADLVWGPDPADKK
jgi:hypothetical protein